MAYTVDTAGELRIITMPKVDGMRFRFYKYDSKERVKFTIIGAKLQAIVQGKIIAYKKPNVNHFHFELMQANRGALSRGEGGADSERILENMLECVEII